MPKPSHPDDPTNTALQLAAIVRLCAREVQGLAVGADWTYTKEIAHEIDVKLAASRDECSLVIHLISTLEQTSRERRRLVECKDLTRRITSARIADLLYLDRVTEDDGYL